MRLDADIQKEIVKLYLSGKSAYDISPEVKVSIGTVYNCLSRHGVTRSNKINSRRYSLNHDYFEIIDTEAKAYWLGFIQTDGYLTTNTSSVGIALAEKDRDHLEKFKSDIEATYPINTYRSSGYSNGPYSRIVVKSEKMWNDLVLLGVTPQKTKTTLPLDVPNDLQRHYVRGLMDGDGSIKKAKQSRSGYRGDFVSAQREMAQFMADRLGVGAVRLDKKKNVWYSEFTLTEQNLDYLYEEATTYLSRKYERGIRARGRLRKTGVTS